MEIDYVKRDLDFVSRNIQRSHVFCCSKCGSPYNCGHEEKMQFRAITNWTFAFIESAFQPLSFNPKIEPPYIKLPNNPTHHIWDSIGAQTEYKFAQKEDIDRVLAADLVRGVVSHI
jgi:hypothetical protein